MGSGGRRVAVVGGGIAGLAAARALAIGEDAPEVVLFETDQRLGGKLLTSPFAGRAAIDEGPDAFLARLPWGTELARAVGLGGALVAPCAGRAAVWWEQLHDIPQGLLLGMPTDVMALARSKLLTWPGKLRAAMEPLRPRTSTAPDSLGGYVRDRFGNEVHLRLVDPLVGSIYAADTDHFSLAAVPQIADLAGRARSILIAGRKLPAPSASAGPVFYAPLGGMGDLAAHTAVAATDAGAQLRLGATVQELAADGAGWRVDGNLFDAVVLACPAAPASRLLADIVPDASRWLFSIPAADVAMVTIAVPAADWPARLRALSGYLVPKPMQRLVTATSFGSQKWAHWASAHSVLLRISLGRDGLPVLHLPDETLLTAAVEEVSNHIGHQLHPVEQRVTRWTGAFPQYRPHHADTVATVERMLPAGIAIAGASYHGIGVPACINSGTKAATSTAAFLRSMAQ
jgi:oxygen-dependent protoporphyrinogen oxidase